MSSTNWQSIRRPDQTTPEDPWDVWVVSGGRGSGKSRIGAEEAIHYAETHPRSRLLLVARTASDVRTTMVEGESGILSLYGAKNPNAPLYQPSVRRLTWPNGSTAVLMSAQEPDAIRGIQADFTWADEVADWPLTPDRPDAWDQVRLATRLGRNPRIVVTTTPHETPMLERLDTQMVADPESFWLTEMHMLDNGKNLNPRYVSVMYDKYIGTKFWDTEIAGLWPWRD